MIKKIRNLVQTIFMSERENVPAELPLIIYQNTYFTESLISIIEGGLEDQQLKEDKSNNAQSVHGETGIDTNQLMQFLISANFQGKGEIDFNQFSATQRDIKITDSFRFSKIKQYIQNNKKLTIVSNDTKTENLQLGQFIEFTSSYKKNEIRELMELFMREDSFDLLWKIHNKYSDQSATSGASKKNKDYYFYKDIFKKILEVLKVDFPPESASLDFYGQIEEAPIQNVLICDTKFFVQEDKSRILDGRFKVLGKVVDIQEEGNESEQEEKYFSQLDRNKFLKRIEPEALDEFGDWLSSIIGEFSEGFSDGGQQLFDSKFNLTLKGDTIKVLPIIIYT